MSSSATVEIEKSSGAPIPYIPKRPVAVANQAEMNAVNDSIERIRSRISIPYGCAEDAVDVPHQLLNQLKELIGEFDFLNAEPRVYRKILNNLAFHFQNDVCLVNDSGESPSDIEDLLRYKPTEVIGDKCTQIFCYTCVGEMERANEELRNLKKLLENPLMGLHASLEDGFLFLAKTLELFKQLVSASSSLVNEMFGGDVRPSFNKLSPTGKVAVKVVRAHFLRSFRSNVVARIALLKEATENDPTNCEWLITLAEVVRRKRRDTPGNRSRHPDEKEFEYIDIAYGLARDNPFVILGLTDCIIDCLRNKGSFTCGGVSYDSSSHTAAFMKSTCRKLLQDFPRSVRIYSQVSDYFARFVPLRYFDVTFAGECLEHAYSLNPNYPKTTHRKGIFYRMSKGAITASFEWFKLTLKLDPGHYNAFIEVVKNMIGRPTEYDLANYIRETILDSPGASYWSEHEFTEVLFYKGIGHFIKGETQEALGDWQLIINKSPALFRLAELDQNGGFYNWDVKLISSDMLKLWMNEEREKLESSPDSGDGSEESKIRSRRKALVNSIFDLMIGVAEPSRFSLNQSPFALSSTYEQYKKQMVCG